MTWANGRQMTSYTKGDDTVTFTYDGAGNRLSKTVNGTATTYAYVGGRLYGQQTGADKLVFLYDANGSVYGFTYNGVSYYYHRNIQGDVLGIYDSTGTELVTYSYGVWGLPTGMTDTSTNGIGTINPIRYRGYLYDAELGFYWLTTRFYDPEIGRFINADGYVSTGQGILGYNMYAYCGNDPVGRVDPTGESWVSDILAITFTIYAVVSLYKYLTAADESVLVLSNNHEEWLESSETMGRDLANATGAYNFEVQAVTDNNFQEVWTNTKSKYMIIHTHGTPASLNGDGLDFTVANMYNLPTNTNIEFVLITACSVGGDNGGSANMGQAISHRISPNGMVICSTTVVVGADKCFVPTNGGRWVVYRNGNQSNARLPSSIFMWHVARYWRWC